MGVGKEGTDHIRDNIRNTLVQLKKEKKSYDQRMGSVNKERDRFKCRRMGYLFGFFIWIKKSSSTVLFIPLEEVKYQ